MKLIAGLGNPGPEYRYTRHNLGFIVVDRLAQRLGVSISREKYKGLIAETLHNGQKLMLLKPLTYMNRSGESVAQASRNRVTDFDDLLVVYDEIDLPLGKIRMRENGSPGTHNGMKSVVAALGTRDVPRLRIGVGDERRGDLAEHVLSTFRPDERETVEATVERAVDGILCWLESGIDRAMNVYNT